MSGTGAATPTFELCAETLDACTSAKLGGANRIELCVNLHLDGTTPPPAMIARAVAESGLPVHVLVRPGVCGHCARPQADRGVALFGPDADELPHGERRDPHLGGPQAYQRGRHAVVRPVHVGELGGRALVRVHLDLVLSNG